MKHLSTILSLIAIAGVTVLFFKNNNSSKKAGVKKVSNDSASIRDIETEGKVAYFEMDSLENNYSFMKDAREKLKQKEAALTKELESTKNGYMNRLKQLQEKAQSGAMSQQEQESAQNEYMQMQQKVQQQEGKVAQQLQELQLQMLKEIHNNIKEFLNEYNEDKKYAYILSHSDGDFVYYKDSTLNITNDLLEGLNKKYAASKTDK